MSYRLFLDDIRPKPDGEWIVARSFKEAIDVVECFGFPVFISFDHDLGADGDRPLETGYDFTKWLVNRDMDSPCIPEGFEYHVHSANPVGRDNILSYLGNYLKFRSNYWYAIL